MAYCVTVATTREPEGGVVYFFETEAEALAKTRRHPALSRRRSAEAPARRPVDEPERPNRDAVTARLEIILLVALGVIAIAVTLTFF